VLRYRDRGSNNTLTFFWTLIKVGSLNVLYDYYVTVKVGIGGFSMGAAIALYSATCYAMGRYGNGIPYPVNLRAVVGLSGWLPGSRYPIL
jgi:hypothetical protein